MKEVTINQLVKIRKLIRMRKTTRKAIVKEKNHGKKNLTIVKVNQAHIAIKLG